MSPRPPGTTAVTLFAGGRGAASIARGLLRVPGVGLSLVINGYDNGLSTGALRRCLPGMLGPSDFRKNLLLHLDRSDPPQAAMRSVLEYRLPAGTTRRDLGDLIEGIASLRHGLAPAAFASLRHPTRAAIVEYLRCFADRLGTDRLGTDRLGTDRLSADRLSADRLSADRLSADPYRLELADCALGNLVFAGAYLALGERFNPAVHAFARTFESPVRLLNVTNGENAFLVALKQDGTLLADEADIVAPQDAGAITDLFLLPEPITAWCRAGLRSWPAEQVRDLLARHRAEVTPNPLALEAIRDADLIVYGPGTPHSSLLPSYLTPGVADAIGESRAVAKVFVVNARSDHDIQRLTAPDLVDHTLRYLGDPGNDRRTITHVLCHRPAPSSPDVPLVPRVVADRGEWRGARWVTADLEDPVRPGVHCGRRTVDALTGIRGQAALARD